MSDRTHVQPRLAHVTGSLGIIAGLIVGGPKWSHRSQQAEPTSLVWSIPEGAWFQQQPSERVDSVFESGRCSKE